MKLIEYEEVVAENLDVALQAAREIFPYEEKNGQFRPEAGYRESIEKNWPRFKYYLAHVAGIVVGTTGHYPLDDENSELWIGWFGVRPCFRRLGFGRHILDWTMTKILTYQDRVILWSGDRVEERNAHKLYLSKGFVECGRDEIDGEPVITFVTKVVQ